MKERDKSILASLSMFRVMTRDQIIRLHFSQLKEAVKRANDVLLRLRRDGHIQVSKERRMYMYFPSPSIRKDSAKLQHYLALCDFYLECRSHEQPRRFTIEPRITEKGGPEPDLFMIWKNTPFYVELQRTVFSKRVMDEKLMRYEAYYDSEEWKAFDWQPEGKPIFPRVWILTPQPYLLNTVSFPVVQTKDVSELLMRYYRK